MKSIKTVRIVLAAAVALVAFGGIVATAAQAEGPYWIVKCHKVLTGNVAESRWEDAACSKLKTGGGFDRRLLNGETRAIKSSNVGALKLISSTGVTIECKKESNAGKIIGGNPGTDSAEITFTECSVAPKTVAECAASSGSVKGEIKSNVKTVLAYPEGEAPTNTRALDAFTPQESNDLFAVFTLEGTNCALLNKEKVEVKATGSLIKINGEERQCGVLAEVGKLVGGAFVRTVSGELATEGALNFKEKPITKAELQTGTTTFTKIECKLEAFKATAEEVGLAKEETEPAEEFGWEK
jgi:hypothetical protein